MMKFQSSFGRAVLAALCLAPSAATANPKVVKVPAAAAAPVEVGARYGITLNGFDLGSLDFNSRVQGNTYTADSDVQLSALLGAFKWRGVTRTSGTMTGAAHRPQGYSFEFHGNGRSGQIQMGFTGAEITTLTVKPETFTTPDTVPLERKHLSGALDPLSTILAMTRTEASQPCGRTYAIFDGKQRFDLALSFRRHERLAVAGREPETLVVCKVKYTPVAGYRATAETQSLAANNGIEIAFRHVPSAGLMVPHRVVIPTLAGDAVIEAERVSVASGARGEVAQAD